MSLLRNIAMICGLALLSSYIQAEMVVQTPTVKGTKPRITSNVGIFNHTNKDRAPKVGDDIRHYIVKTADDEGDAVSVRIEWLRDGELIPGTEDDGDKLTYRPVAADIGKRLSVRMFCWTDPNKTDPSEGDLRYSKELEPVTP